jgi:putative tricarboxylic transport membrane protein
MGAANLIGGTFILILGVTITYFSSQMTYMSEYGPGPGLLPFWIGLGLSACASLTIVKAIVQRRKQSGKFFQPKTGRVVFILGALIITFLLVWPLGLALSLALFTGFTMRATGRHSWILCCLMAIATAAAVRIIFGYMLDIPLPKGLIGI